LKSNRLVDFFFRELWNVERHEAYCEQALIATAEIGNRAIVRAGSAVKNLGRRAHLVELTPEMGDRERGENQLRIEAEQIECASALVGIESTERFPSFAEHEIRFRIGERSGIGPAICGVRDRFFDHPAARANRERMKLRAHVGIGVGNQPVLSLHDVAVGVVEDSALGV